MEYKNRRKRWRFHSSTLFVGTGNCSDNSSAQNLRGVTPRTVRESANKYRVTPNKQHFLHSTGRFYCETTKLPPFSLPVTIIVPSHRSTCAVFESLHFKTIPKGFEPW